MTLRKEKEKALDRNMWGARFGKGFGPVVRETTKWMNEWRMTKQDKQERTAERTGHIYSSTEKTKVY